MSSSETQIAGSQKAVFIDPHVPDIQDLREGLAPGVQAFVLNASIDGVQQIADILADNNLTNLASILIVGHGAPAPIDVGSAALE